MIEHRIAAALSFPGSSMTDRKEAVTIRPATALDAVNIAKLLKAQLGADQDQLRVNDKRMVQWVMTTLDTAFVAVADCSGRIVGSIAMSPMQQPWSDDWFMGETWFTVKPSVHADNTAKELLEMAEQFADSKALALFFKVPATDTDKDSLLSERRDFHFMGTAYYREAKRDVQSGASTLA